MMDNDCDYTTTASIYAEDNLFVPEDEQLELKPFVDKALKKRRFG